MKLNDLYKTTQQLKPKKPTICTFEVFFRFLKTKNLGFSKHCPMLISALRVSSFSLKRVFVICNGGVPNYY